MLHNSILMVQLVAFLVQALWLWPLAVVFFFLRQLKQWVCWEVGHVQTKTFLWKHITCALANGFCRPLRLKSQPGLDPKWYQTSARSHQHASYLWSHCLIPSLHQDVVMAWSRQLNFVMHWYHFFWSTNTYLETMTCLSQSAKYVFMCKQQCIFFGIANGRSNKTMGPDALQKPVDFEKRHICFCLIFVNNIC